MAANVLLKGNQTPYCGVSSLHFLTPGGLYLHFCYSFSTLWPPCILAGPHTHHDPASFRGITCNCPFRLQSFYPCGLSMDQPSRTTSTKTTMPFHCSHVPCSFFCIKPIRSQQMLCLQFNFHVFLSPLPSSLLKKNHGLSFLFSLIFSNPSTPLFKNYEKMPFTISWCSLSFTHVIPASCTNVLLYFPYTRIKTSLCSLFSERL